DKIRSQTKPFLYLFQLVGAKDPVHELVHGSVHPNRSDWITACPTQHDCFLLGDFRPWYEVIRSALQVSLWLLLINPAIG
ncbi:hypothetical protein ACK3YB_19500, partial [Aeromonas caviae]